MTGGGLRTEDPEYAILHCESSRGSVSRENRIVRKTTRVSAAYAATLKFTAADPKMNEECIDAWRVETGDPCEI